MQHDATVLCFLNYLLTCWSKASIGVSTTTMSGAQEFTTTPTRTNNLDKLLETPGHIPSFQVPVILTLRPWNVPDKHQTVLNTEDASLYNWLLVILTGWFGKDKKQSTWKKEK